MGRMKRMKMILFLALGAAPAGAGEPAVPTFSREVAPILERRCQSCHRPGEVAPMSLLNYADARPWAESIKEQVVGRQMPPWHADPRYGRFQNDPTLSEEELRTLVGWVDAGAPEGDPKELPAARSWTPGWSVGRPDLVLSMKEEYQVPEKGVVPYRYFVVPTGFSEDRWVQAAEVRPGNRAVVHHILVFVLTPEMHPDELAARDLIRHAQAWNLYLGGTAPGEDPAIFPQGAAKRIPRGSSLLFQVHYTPNGKAASDRSSIGLFFAAESPKLELVTRAVANQLFLIPPGSPDHQVMSQYTFSRDARIYSFMPHMHLRGKSFEYRAVFPDGEEKVLLSVPRYDFNWQHIYRLAEPLAVPRGTKIYCRATYDNSVANKKNPDPSKLVHWGDQTWEEMMIGFITFTREPQRPRAVSSPAVSSSSGSAGAEPVRAPGERSRGSRRARF
jgi:hypothetical protein